MTSVAQKVAQRADIAEKHRVREEQLEIIYLPVLMEGTISKLFSKECCFSISQIAGMWRSFEVDKSKIWLYDATGITQNFIKHWEDKHTASPPRPKKDAKTEDLPPFNVIHYTNDPGFIRDVTAYVCFKIMDAKLEHMRFVDVRVLAQAIAWRINRINDGCIYQCLGKALKENPEFTPETAAAFTEAVVATLKTAWAEVAIPEFENLKTLLLQAMEQVKLSDITTTALSDVTDDYD